MFDLMFVIVPVFIGLTAVAVFVLVISGFIRHRNMAKKIFTLAERELDQRLAQGGEPQSVVCSHCGTRVSAGDDCPNCGASLA